LLVADGLHIEVARAMKKPLGDLMMIELLPETEKRTLSKIFEILSSRANSIIVPATSEIEPRRLSVQIARKIDANMQRPEVAGTDFSY